VPIVRQPSDKSADFTIPLVISIAAVARTRFWHKQVHVKKTTCLREEPMDADRLAKLESELIAIDVWNSAYFLSQQHDDIDEVSYRHRRNEEKNS
jgi:hypothetical protein